jgi:hypothetical protein
MGVISALEHALSQTHEPGLRQQLTDTIQRLREHRRREEGRVAPGGESRRTSQPKARRRKSKTPC